MLLPFSNHLVFSPELYPVLSSPEGCFFTPLYLSHPLCSTSPAIPTVPYSRFLFSQVLRPVPCLFALTNIFNCCHHTFWNTWPDHAYSCGQLPPQTAVSGSCTLDFENIVCIYIPEKTKSREI